MSRPAVPYTPVGFFALRTPLLPAAEFDQVFSPIEVASGDPVDTALFDANVDATRRELQRLFGDPIVAEALFVGSPALHASIVAVRADGANKPQRKVDLALARYVARMCSRSTPFGLFAGVSVGEVASASRVAIDARATYRAHARIDTQVLAGYLDHLVAAPALRDRLRYVVTPSLYPLGDRFRYSHIPLTRSVAHPLVEVGRSPALMAVLERAQTPRVRDELADVVAGAAPSATPPERIAYVDGLIDEAVLVPALLPRLTGEEPAHEYLDLALGDAWQPRLRVAADCLVKASRAALGDALPHYQAAQGAVGDMQLELGAPDRFQVDLVKPATGATIGPAVIGELLNAALEVNRVSPAAASPVLARFRQRFVERYEGQEVPLVEALDEDAGVGLDEAVTLAPVAALDGLPPFGGETPQGPTWTARDQWLASLLHRALRLGHDEIEITRADKLPNSPEAPRELPAAFSAMTTLLTASDAACDSGDFQLFGLELLSPTGLGLFARFCHAEPALTSHLRRAVELEDRLAGDAIVADIVHVSIGRTANVMLRPSLRAYEIVCHARAGAPKDRQIPAADLLVAVDGERISLRSGRLGRAILPRRMDMVWAPNDATAPIYRFLSLLAGDATPFAGGWNWGALARSEVLPRVRIGKTIVSAASWNLSAEALAPLLSGSGAQRMHAVERIRESLRMPSQVAIVLGDNLLPLELRNATSIELLARAARGAKNLVLRELPTAFGPPGVAGPEGRYLNELAVPFVRTADPSPGARAATSAAPPRRGAGAGAIVRRVIPGDDVLYAKLFVGASSHDAVLAHTVRPTIRDPWLSGAIKRWFFVRYDDGGEHLRLRMFGPPDRLWREALPILRERADRWVSSGTIWRVEIATYEREIERYGGDEGMALAEQLFHLDSEACLELIDVLERHGAEQERWTCVALAWDTLMSDFGMQLRDRRAFARRSAAAFAREFRFGAPFATALAPKMRTWVAQSRWILGPQPGEPQWAVDARRILARRSARGEHIRADSQELARSGRLSVELEAYVWGQLHMHANRMLPAAARQQEYIVYELLDRLYRGALARAKEGARAR